MKFYTDKYRQTLIAHLRKHGYKIVMPGDIGSILQREPIRFENSDVTITMFGSRYDVRWGGRSGALHATVCKTFGEVRTRLDRLFKEEEIKKHDFEQERHRFEPLVERLRTIDWLADADLRLNLQPTNRKVYPEIALHVPGVDIAVGWIHFNLDLSVETFVFGHDVRSKLDFDTVMHLLESEEVFAKLDKHIDPMRYSDERFYVKSGSLPDALPYLLYMKAKDVRRVNIVTDRSIEGYRDGNGNLCNLPLGSGSDALQRLLSDVQEYPVFTGLCDTKRYRERFVTEDDDDDD